MRLEALLNQIRKTKKKDSAENSENKLSKFLFLKILWDY